MIKRAEDMVKLYNEHMRGGDGTVEIIRYLEPEEFNGNAKMIAKLVLKPVTLHEGDSCVCLGGQTHGIRNASDTENLEAFAVILLY